MARFQSIQHIKGNNLTIAGGNIAAIPNAGVLLPGELAINFNEKDPTIIIGSVVNSGITSTSVSATTHVSEFKSKKWLETYILGTADTSQVKTLKYISDTLGLLVGNDADTVVNTWEEIKTFLSSIPNGETYDLMTLLNNKASTMLTVNGTSTKLYDNISLIATSGTVSSINYSTLKINVGTILPNTNTGEWVDGVYILPEYSDNSNTQLRTPRLDQVRDFYEKFNRMFTLDEVGGVIRVNYDLYSVGEISAYGLGSSGGTGGGTGGTSYSRLDYWADYTVDKSGWVLSAGLGNDLNTRLTAIEGNGATTIDFAGAGNAITNVTKSGTTLTFTKGLTFLTANQNITLTGDVTGSGTTSITTSISSATVTSKILTGYVVGSNSALSATDSILSAFGKIQAQINARPGTVTSIGMTLPTGLQVSPSAITSAGTFAIAFTSGYSIPTNTKQSQWDTAYTNNHTHTNYSVLTGITSTNINNWDIAYYDTFSATSNNTSNTLVKRDGSGNFSANTITASLSGNASTATKLSSTRTFQLTGDVTGTITSDLSTGATISTTIAANSVALGTDTTGNYAGSISVSGSGLSLSGSAGEGTNYTITSNATSNNVPSTIVYRDSSGDFVAGSIIAEESFNYSTNAYTTYNSITKTIDFVFN